jgi:hypothetical protein
MSIKTQIRLQQLTGSVSELKPSSLAVGNESNIASHSNLKDILAYYAQAIANIHGEIDFGAAEIATFKGDSNQINRFGSDLTGSPSLTIQANDNGVSLNSQVSGANMTFNVNRDEEVFSIDGQRNSLVLSQNNPIEFGAEQRRLLWDGSQLILSNSSGDIHLSSSVTITKDAANIQLVSDKIEIKTDALFNYSGNNTAQELMLFASASEGATFQQRFDDMTTIIGALNKMKLEIEDVKKTAKASLFDVVIQENISSGNPVSLLFNSGDKVTFDQTISPFEGSFYLNGQLLFSGSQANLGTVNSDYYVSGENQVVIGFDLKIDDILVFIDNSVFSSEG